ncbi:MAG: PASTA domain-containing protein [Candidatus Aminicenantales bacterium]
MLSRKLYNLFLYTLIFLNLFFLTAILSYNFVLRGELIPLPDLQGKSVEEARLELAKKKLSLRVKGTQYSSSVEKGLIVAQEPGAGSKIKLNRTIRVILSSGKEMVTVPELKGITVENSVQVLRETGLLRGSVSHVYSVQFPAGNIIAQQPPPLTKAPRNTPVNVLVSRGVREPKFLMPDLIGMKAETVMAKLKEMNFKVAEVRYTYYPGQEAGIIITQLPPPGFSIQRNSLIALEISKE